MTQLNTIEQIRKYCEEKASWLERSEGDTMSTDLAIKILNVIINATSEKQEEVELPSPYEGELNTKRIKAYRNLSEQYNVQLGTVRDIFCKGADWYQEQIKTNSKTGKMAIKASDEYCIWCQDMHPRYINGCPNPKPLDGLSANVIESKNVKMFIDYLAKESNGEHTEFRVVIYDNGKGYAHVMNRDSESIDFDLPKFFKRK